MTILQPGEHWEGLEIVGNDRFRSRAKRAEPTQEEVFFSKAVYAAEMCQRQGWDVNPETMRMVNEDLRTAPLQDLLRTDKFQNALAARGIPMSTKTGLSPRQIACIAIYFDTSTPATLPQKLKMMGTTRLEWDGWYRQPAFAARMAELSEDMTAQNTPLALQRLQQALDQGAPWAIQFSLAMQKRYDPKAETVDPMIAVRQILDDLDELLDSATLERLNERMQARREGRPIPQGNVLRIDPAAPVAEESDAGLD